VRGAADLCVAVCCRVLQSKFERVAERARMLLLGFSDARNSLVCVLQCVVE